VTRLFPLMPLCLVLVAAGCEVYTMCTDDRRSSLTVSVVDEAGAPIEGATGTYSIDGGVEANCDEGAAGMLTCGWEVAGDMTVTVSAKYHETQTFTERIEADECHVLGEEIEVTLLSVDCTAEVVPSIEVTVTDSQGVDITAADVMWNMAAEDDLPEPCTQQGGNVWVCGEEVAGELVVEIDNAGPYEPYRELVTVDEDECHVITEQFAAVLQYLPD
jgi:hypothetical protein